MLKSLRVSNYRSFPEYTLTFGDGALLMGPNNAGKTTLLTALRVTQTLLRYARNRGASEWRTHSDRRVRAYPALLRDYPSLTESVRHEFGTAETTLQIEWKNAAQMTVVWPSDDGGDDLTPFFYLVNPESFSVSTTKAAKNYFSLLGIIPPLGPVDHEERLLDAAYVRSNLESRLSSRHFRNQLHQLNLDGDWALFTDWIQRWVPNIALDPPQLRGSSLDVFYVESGSRIPKELTWAGDGIQVWLQILFHVFRNRENTTLVLDEPEVFLHPDLQHRLVDLLEASQKQVVMATHSAEIAAAADPRLVTLVDKSKRRAVRPKSAEQMEALSQLLGTSFNLRLAKAMRARRVIFVEGKDMRVLRHFAQTLGHTRLATESGIAVIQLGGFSSHEHIPAFRWLASELLPGAADVRVILDRDYRSDAEVSSVLDALAMGSIKGHVWDRKELESYTIHPAVIGRLAEVSTSTIETLLDFAAAEQESDLSAQMFSHSLKSNPKHLDISTQHKAHSGAFAEKWAERSFRIWRTNAKSLISALNRQLTCRGHQTVTAFNLAKAHRRAEIPSELADLLADLNTDW